MTVDEFLVWLEDKADRTRYELIAGRPVAMAREPVAHARTKAQLWLVLRDVSSCRGCPARRCPTA
jgi:hypothetical protein